MELHEGDDIVNDSSFHTKRMDPVTVGGELGTQAIINRREFVVRCDSVVMNTLRKTPPLPDQQLFLR